MVRSPSVIGELSLSGAIRPVRGVLPALCGAAAQGVTRAIVPRDNAREAAAAPGVQVGVVGHLRDLVAHLRGDQPLPGPGEAMPAPSARQTDIGVDLEEIRGQHAARRALEIAAAGGHNLVMMGPPGSGKTMLARRLPTILPPLGFEEAIEVTAIHSIAGLLSPDRGLVGARPFRAPHHSVSAAGLVGGGDPVRPGEVSLAHHGCLFLDELLEFRRGAIEALRQPLEEGQVAICRARGRVTFPARPLVVAAINPCPCGFAGDRLGRCSCNPERVRTYKARLSGPILDRIDLQITLPPVEVAQLSGGARGEPSAAVRARVEAARAAQRARFLAGEATAPLNAALGPRDFEGASAPDEAGARLLERSMERLGLSARAYGKVLRVARTIADLAGSTALRGPHVAEAIGLRLIDRDAGAALPQAAPAQPPP